jgi:uncharacterized membrane protein
VTLYELFKAIHVLAAASWVGAVVVDQAHAYWLRRRTAPEDFLHYAALQAWLGRRYYMPLAIVTLAAGVAMVIESAWAFSDLWIVIGIFLFVVTVVLGAAYMGPQGDKILAALERGGPPAAELQRRIKNVTFASRIDTVVLVLVVIDMVVKPGV